MIMNQRCLSYEMLRTENSLKTTKFRPIEDGKYYAVNNHHNDDATEKTETTSKIVFEVYPRKCSGQKSYSDNILPKNRPTKTRCKFTGLTKRKTPYKEPSQTARKSRSNDTPEFEENIVGNQVQSNTRQKNKHFCLWTPARS